MMKLDPTLKDKLNTIVRYCITKSPGFASIALWIPYHIYSEDSDLIACTDGRSIRVGQRFFDYQPAQQAFIVIHEVMHVALRHVSAIAQKLQSHTLEHRHRCGNQSSFASHWLVKLSC